MDFSSVLISGLILIPVAFLIFKNSPDILASVCGGILMAALLMPNSKDHQNEFASADEVAGVIEGCPATKEPLKKRSSESVSSITKGQLKDIAAKCNQQKAIDGKEIVDPKSIPFSPLFKSN